MKTKKNFLKIGIATVILGFGLPLKAAESPKTMEEMWQLIKAQQEEIETLKAKVLETDSQPLKKAGPEASKGGATETTKNGAQATKQVQKTAGEETKTKKRVQTLEYKTSVLAQAVEKLRTLLHIPEKLDYKSMHGLGPAASKIYQIDQGLSIGGYGEARYQMFLNGKNKDNADFARLVLYTGYKFTDWILLNSEIEFEHATTGEGAEEKGEVSVEFAALDFLLDPRANVRAGLVLLPMGFLNLIHEPPFYFGNHRPMVEQLIIPTTWSEMGVGLFGNLLPGLSYTAYVVNGLNAKDFESSGIGEGTQGGSQALAESFAFVGRLDYAPPGLPGLSFGGSAYVGNAGQDQAFEVNNQIVKPDVFTQLYEVHLQWRHQGWWFRALGAWGHIDDADVLSVAKGEVIGESNFGWYTEIAYNVLPLIWPKTTQYLAPFFRFEHVDTIADAPSRLPPGLSRDEAFDANIYQVGINYKPIPNVVIKADYRNFEADNGHLADEFNLGIGFIF